MRLLLLEDDEALGDGLAGFLRAEGDVVDWFRQLQDVKLLSGEPYDALLIDWQLPDGSGLEWLRRLRRGGVDTPVIVLTARDQLADRIRGLDEGADDYLVKPFAPEELAARLRALRRRQAGQAHSWVRFGPVDIHLSHREVKVDGKEVDVTQREWQILEALVTRPGRLVSKSELEALILGFDQDIASNALEVHLSRLRRKLVHDLIETQRGRGYRWRVAS